MAIFRGQVEVLHKMWEWAKEVLTQEELHYIWFAKDRDERTAWLMAAKRGELELLNCGSGVKRC
jgi:hypothetical protein